MKENYQENYIKNVGTIGVIKLDTGNDALSTYYSENYVEYLEKKLEESQKESNRVAEAARHRAEEKAKRRFSKQQKESLSE